MKRAFSILFLLSAFRLQGQIPQTNTFIIADDNSSWTDSQYGTIDKYLQAGLDAVFPQWTNGVYDIGHSGASAGLQYTAHQEKEELLILCLASTNGVALFNAVAPNDNGGYGTPDYLLQIGTNMFAAPPLWWNGTAQTNEGISLPIINFADGGLMSPSIDGDNGAVTRQTASDTINSFRLSPISPDVWHDTKTNLAVGVNIQDVTGHVLFYNGGHPTPAHSAAIFIARWRSYGFPTNIFNICFNYNAGTVAASNHVAAVSLSKSGNTFSCTVRFDRMAPRFDRICPTTPNGVVSNNVAMPDVYTYFPTYQNVFQAIIQVTNLPPGSYTASLDGVAWFTNTDVELAEGVNVATNLANVSLNLQGDKLLSDYQDKTGKDPITGLDTHNAGSGGVGGIFDRINFMSIANNDYDTLGRRGAAHVNAMYSTTAQWRSFDAVMFNDAQQTNHTLVIQPVKTMTVTNLNVGNLIISQAPAPVMVPDPNDRFLSHVVFPSNQMASANNYDWVPEIASDANGKWTEPAGWHRSNNTIYVARQSGLMLLRLHGRTNTEP